MRKQATACIVCCCASVSKKYYYTMFYVFTGVVAPHAVVVTSLVVCYFIAIRDVSLHRTHCFASLQRAVDLYCQRIMATTDTL
jgi:hypothetical protein